MLINSSLLGILAMFCMAIGLGIVLWEYTRRKRQKDHIEAVIQGRQTLAPVPESDSDRQRWGDGLLNVVSNDWLNTAWGRQLVAQEDRDLLAQCGYQNARSRGYFLLARVLLAILLPAIVLLLFHASMHTAMAKLIATVMAVGIGFLLPKWVLRSRASKRMKQASKELPVLVDLLCLLQGAGLGMDQSLQMIAQDFRGVMPVLSAELSMANRLHASGRSREQALQRMSEMFKSDALADLSALIVQIDKHGGAVQEPLMQFAQRLRESRRMQMKEEIGKITVKMTVVMILTLLPSLMIIIAGPGFLSVIRALGGMQR